MFPKLPLPLLPGTYDSLHPESPTPTVRADFQAVVPTLTGQDWILLLTTPICQTSGYLGQVQIVLRERDTELPPFPVLLHPSVPIVHLSVPLYEIEVAWPPQPFLVLAMSSNPVGDSEH